LDPYINIEIDVERGKNEEEQERRRHNFQPDTMNDLSIIDRRDIRQSAAQDMAKLQELYEQRTKNGSFSQRIPKYQADSRPINVLSNALDFVGNTPFDFTTTPQREVEKSKYVRPVNTIRYNNYNGVLAEPTLRQFGPTNGNPFENAIMTGSTTSFNPIDILLKTYEKFEKPLEQFMGIQPLSVDNLMANLK
jgi:hypothetical protein